jgi:formate dehydrogenase iron-sulfur subunit
MSIAILYDGTICAGCRICEEACAKRRELPYDARIAREERLSAHKLTTIVTRNGACSRKLCMHCGDPACASACPVSALRKTALGPVVYQESRCIGCRYCMVACPYQVPAYEWDQRLPRMVKCDMCHDRLADGETTECARYCPSGATVSGDRQALIREAERRIAANPDRYFPRIYGLKDAGGGAVLMLSSVALEQLDFQAEVPQEPLPQRTWKALSSVPDLAALGSAFLGGVWWITRRRAAVAAEGESESAGGKGGGVQ